MAGQRPFQLSAYGLEEEGAGLPGAGRGNQGEAMGMLDSALREAIAHYEAEEAGEAPEERGEADIPDPLPVWLAREGEADELMMQNFPPPLPTPMAEELDPQEAAVIRAAMRSAPSLGDAARAPPDKDVPERVPRSQHGAPSLAAQLAASTPDIAAAAAAAAAEDCGYNADSLAQGLASMQLDDIDASDGDDSTGDPIAAAAAGFPAPNFEAAARPRAHPAPTNFVAVDADPIAALEVAIEADKPKFKPSPEWLKMIESVDQELDGGGSLLWGDAPETAEAEMAREDAAVAGAAASTRDPVQQGDGGGIAQRNTQAAAQQRDPMLEGHGAAELLGAEDEGPQAHAAETAKGSTGQERQETFRVLQPVCSVLLQQRADAKELAAALRGLEALLLGAQPAGLQACFDYVMFPLHLMLDSIAAARMRHQGAGSTPVLSVPAMAADGAAEAALGCLHALLQRCHCQEGDKLVGLLQRLAAVLALSATSEELRHRALQCVGAAAAGVHAAPARVHSQLRALDTAPLLGHLTSLLLQAADAEVQAGSKGSKAVRVAALLGLQALVGAVTSPQLCAPNDAADVLAFFLPGIVLGLGKACISAVGSRAAAGVGEPAKGAASSSAAAAAALSTLCRALCVCLGDAVVDSVLQREGDASLGAGDAAGWGGSAASSGAAESAMQRLEELSHRVQRHDASGIATAAGGEVEMQAADTLLQPDRGAHRPPAADAEAPRLRVENSAVWVRDTAHRVHEVLDVAVTPLLLHPSPVVRAALASGCCALLDTCRLALEERTQDLLLQVLLSAAQDEWHEVTQIAQPWLQHHADCELSAAAGAVAASGFVATLERHLLELLRDLPAQLRSGEAAGIAHARKLVSCMQVFAPSWLASNVIQHPVRQQHLVAACMEAFAFEPSSAGLLLYAAGTPEASTWYAANPGAAAHTPVTSTGPAAALLPRMPLGLVGICSARAYEAAATVPRTAAKVAALADASAGSGTALRALTDALVRQLQHDVNHGDVGRGPKRSRSAPSAPGAAKATYVESAGPVPWQLQAASAAVVLGEVLYGASPAWQPRWELQPSTAHQVGGAANQELESVCAAALQELMQEAVWSLPTSAPAEGVRDGAALLLEDATGDPQGRPSAQQLGCNALLLKASAECCGAAARGMGTRFVQNGLLLRTCLLPLLEKLADPAQLVASAARAALSSICTWGGYGGSLHQLVSANADYIVDGMCRQLRQLEQHPRAPWLFAALLQEAGVAAGLLPLLAEPARSALQGLSIIARHQHPQHVLPFLRALQQVAAGASAVAHDARAEVAALAATVGERWEARQQELRLAAQLGSDTGLREGMASMGEIGAYFEQQGRQRNQAEQVSQGAPHDSMEAEDEAAKVELNAVENEHLHLLKRRVHAAATLAQTTADCSTPLLLSQSLQVAMLACQVAVDALRVLAATTEAGEQAKEQIHARVSTRSSIGPVDPDTPKLLPSVHLMWSPLMGALTDWRVSVVESALGALGELLLLASTFLMRRLGQDAVPVLQRLLSKGPAQRNVLAPGQDDLSTPAAVQRVQLAALACVQRVAACDVRPHISGVTGTPADALLPCAFQLLDATAELLGDRQPPHVREAATQAFLAIARVDPDAAWCLLTAALRALGSPLPLGTPGALPPLEQLLPVPAEPRAAVPLGLLQCSSGKLEAMQRQAEQLAPRWHGEVLRYLLPA